MVYNQQTLSRSSEFCPTSMQLLVRAAGTYPAVGSSLFKTDPQHVVPLVCPVKAACFRIIARKELLAVRQSA